MCPLSHLPQYTQAWVKIHIRSKGTGKDAPGFFTPEGTLHRGIVAIIHWGLWFLLPVIARRLVMLT